MLSRAMQQGRTLLALPGTTLTTLHCGCQRFCHVPSVYEAAGSRSDSHATVTMQACRLQHGHRAFGTPCRLRRRGAAWAGRSAVRLPFVRRPSQSSTATSPPACVAAASSQDPSNHPDGLKSVLRCALSAAYHLQTPR